MSLLSIKSYKATQQLLQINQANIINLNNWKTACYNFYRPKREVLIWIDAWNRRPSGLKDFMQSIFFKIWTIVLVPKSVNWYCKNHFFDQKISPLKAGIFHKAIKLIVKTSWYKLSTAAFWHFLFLFRLCDDFFLWSRSRFSFNFFNFLDACLSHCFSKII